MTSPDGRGSSRRILVVYGTRPEAVKLAPLIKALGATENLEPVVAVTGQHRQMLDQVNNLFGIQPAYDLDIIKPRQTLTDVTTRALQGLSRTVAHARPDALLVQGDTTTSFTGALAGFYHQVPVVHLEAGLRTGLRHDPFPEEMNRRLTSQLTDLHLAPTPRAKEALIAEGVAPSSIAITGNTVIDALLWTVGKWVPYTDHRITGLLRDSSRVILVTSHRRESWGEPMAAVARAVARLASAHPDVGVVLPAHLNPAVREVLLPPLQGLANVLIVDPLPYGEFCRLMNDSDLILTDSGGVQEEAPSLNKPVLVLRQSTERPEGVTAGVVALVGTDENKIVSETNRILSTLDESEGLAAGSSPYGDGKAAERAVAAISQMFGLGSRLADFEFSRGSGFPDAQRIQAV